jgi:ABC-type multidrug transport system fused ATPase/permease subunit
MSGIEKGTTGYRRYQRLGKYIVRQWSWILLIALLSVAVSLFSALQPWPVKILIDYALGDEPLPLRVATGLSQLGLEPTAGLLIGLAALASLSFFALSSLFDAVLTWSWSVAGQRMVYELAEDLFRRVQRLSLIFHSRNSVGDSLSRLTGDTWCIYSLVDGLLTPGQQIVQVVTFGLIAWKLDSNLATLCFLMAPALALGSFYFGGKMKRRARQSREAQSRLASFVQQTLSAIPVVQAFSTEDGNHRHFRVLADDAVALSQKGVLINSSYGLVSGLILALGSAAVLFFGSQRVLEGSLSLGSLMVFLTYIRRMQMSLEGLLRTYSKLKPVEASLERIFEILEVDEAVQEAERPLTLPAADLRGPAVRVQDVTFGYSPGEPVLQEVSLEAGAGETVAIVGLSGAGKSTLVSLLPRLFDPWQGEITFNGIDIRRLELADLRNQIAVVLQDPYLFGFSVIDNIRYGRPGATMEQVVHAAEAADADEFIRKLPNGYETILGQRGLTLSGGQCQRLSIARALLKDAPLLILDEPTSALDSKTEASLMDALDRLRQGRTTFLIAHRLSTAETADRIVVLEAGRVVESGSPAELLATNGRYRYLHALQYGEAADEVVQ